MAKARKRMMTDSFDIKGLWFLEKENLDVESERVSGILRYTSQRITLELIGSFGEANSFFYESVVYKDHIFGVSDDGEPITLFGCNPLLVRSASPGFETVNYGVSKMYVGALIDSQGEMPVNIRFSFTNLDAWIEKRAVDNYNICGEGRRAFIVDIDRAKRSLLKVEIPEQNLRLSEELSFSFSTPEEYVMGETYKIFVESFYNMTPIKKGEMTLEDSFETIHSVRRLLTLLVGSPMYFKYVDYSFDFSKRNDCMQKTWCRLFFAQVGNCAEVKNINPNVPNSILIRRQDINSDLETVFKAWFIRQDDYNETIQSYINGKYLPEYIYTEFLNCARGLEAFHRFFAEKKFFRPEEEKENRIYTESCNRIRAYIEEEISKECKSYFIRRLEYKEGYTFRKRLKDLIAALPNGLSARLFKGMNDKTLNELISSIVDTRNYYTHRNDVKKHKLAITEPNALYIMTRKLGIVLQYYCLVELGIDKGVVDEALSNGIGFEI